MAILRLSIRPSEPCRFAIFRPKIFKFWTLIIVQNLKIVGLKMAKRKGSDGRKDKRKIAILNIDSILN
jgi:hypothetical protein